MIGQFKMYLLPDWLIDICRNCITARTSRSRDLWERGFSVSLQNSSKMADYLKVFGLLWGLMLSTTLVASETKEFPGTSACYLTYKPQPVIQTESEEIRFEFKTIESSGLILFAGDSFGKRDFLVVELVGGMIRYSAKFGAENDKEDSSVEIFVGDNLAENEWHSVIINRVNRKVRVTLNINKKSEDIRSATLKGFTQLSVDNINVGGLSAGYGSNRGDDKLINSQQNFQGCIRNLQFSVGPKVHELLGSAAVDVTNCVMRNCRSIGYKPFTFPDEESFLSLPTKNNMFTGSFTFRTYSPYAVLVEQRTTSGSAIKISYTSSSVRLDIFEANRPSGTAQVDWMSGQIVDDGNWHTVEFEVTKTSLTLSVKGSGEEKVSVTTVSFTSTVKIGGNFVGCMKDLVINGAVIDVVQVNGNNRPGVIVDKCVSRDYCRPNPCLNKGKCSQKQGTFTCDCTDSAYIGTVCQFADDPRSCAEKKERDPTAVSGKYYIDPDNSGPIPRVEVNCIMKADNLSETRIGTGVTNRQVKSPEDKPVVTLVNYDVEFDSARAIVVASSECKQNIRFQCKNSILINSDEGVNSHWVSYDGKHQNYWGGAPERSGKCGCSVKDTCNSGKDCNCWEKSANDRVDEGDLTDTKSLPVRHVWLGDVGSTSDSQLTVGPLICTGDGTKKSVVTFIYEDGLLRLPTWEASNAGDISLDFKTPYPKGIILDNRGARDDFIQLRIKNQNTLVLLFSLGKDHEQNVEVMLNDNKRLDDSEWHSVQLYHNAKEFVLIVDGIEKKTEIKSVHKLLDLHQTLDVGCYLGDVVNGYIGCLRGLVVNGAVINMEKYIKKDNNYVKIGCQGACHKDACANGGECVDKYNTYICDCSKTPYTGTFCQSEKSKGAATFSGVATFIKHDQFSKKFMSIEDTFILGFTASDCNKMQTLLFVESTDTQQYYQVKLNSAGQAMLLFSISQSEEIKLSETNLCDGKRHSLYINRDLLTVFTRVDSEKMKSEGISGDSTFGNFKAITVANTPAKTEAFKGCLTGVSVQFIRSSDKVTVEPIAQYLASTGSKAGITSGECAADSPVPVTPTPHVPTSWYDGDDGEKDATSGKRSSEDEGNDSAVIILVVLLLVFLIVILLIAIVWFMARNKGVYHTHEGDDEGLNMDDPNVALAGSQPSEGKKKEWFI